MNETYLIYADELKEQLLKDITKLVVYGDDGNFTEYHRMKWIPCSERLPDNYDDCLVTDGYSYAIGYWRDDAKAWDNADFGWVESRLNKIVAWMPLLEPYVERRIDD